MTLSQLESIRAARLQLIDHGDEKTAKLLEWAVTAEPTTPLFHDIAYLLANSTFPRGMMMVGGRLRHPPTVRDEVLAKIDALLPQPQES